MAYAAIVSLGRTLDHILHPDRHVILYDKEVFEPLREKLRFLEIFLEKSPHGVKAFEIQASKIRDAAYEAEDVVESEVYRFQSVSSYRIPDLCINSYGKVLAALQVMFPLSRVFEFGMELRHRMFHWPYFGLNKLIDEIDVFVEEGKEIIEENVQKRDSLPAGSSRRSFSKKSVTVGIDDDLLKMKDRLTGSGSKLEVVPIVGMGGIGKTTLAENVYTDALIVCRFDVRAWITVSQVYNVRDVLLKLLDSCGKLNDKLLHASDDGLAEYLYKNLCERRYLIVMDDLWSTDAWDGFKRYFPNNNNGSRIILTTRLERVAIYAAGTFSPLHHMQFLSDSESWKLLRAKVFGDECCPHQLVEIGREIADHCHGLPLAIVVISGLLSKVNRTPDEWKNVAENLHSIVANDADALLEILFLSYNNLPQHLKACFLYFAIFPEDCKIPASKLIKLWVAEGFLKQNDHKTLEESAEEYLLELAERNLILIFSERHERGHGRIRVVGIHDLLRELCIREAQKEKFLHVMNDCDGFPEGITNQRRVSIYPCTRDPFITCVAHFHTSKGSGSLVRSVIYIGGQPIPSRVYSCFELLRVLDITHVLLFEFPMQILKLVNLRYLAFPYHGDIPESISKLWNLEILIFYPLFKTYAPCPRPLPLAIWSLPRLRHLKFHVWYLSEFPCVLPGWKTNVFLGNLQTLSEVHASFCTQEVLNEIPNLKKLGIWMETWDDAPFYVNNLVCLQQLQVLKCSVRSFPTNKVFPSPNYAFPPQLSFPKGLKELSLRGCRIPWKDMTAIGTLPNLERLKLRDYAFVGPEWEPVEGEFSRLNFLLLDGSDLVQWRADSIHFPLLRHLVVENCWKLDSIPYGIGEIPTLDIIELDDSSQSAVLSLHEIVEEQRSLGNDSLHVHIHRA